MDALQLVRNAVIDIAQDLTGPGNPVTVNTKLHADLGFDSLDYVELLLYLEEDSETKKAFPAESGEIPADITVGQLAQKVGQWVVI